MRSGGEFPAGDFSMRNIDEKRYKLLHKDSGKDHRRDGPESGVPRASRWCGLHALTALPVSGDKSDLRAGLPMQCHLMEVLYSRGRGSECEDRSRGKSMPLARRLHFGVSM